jgi:hypothetical protein
MAESLALTPAADAGPAGLSAKGSTGRLGLGGVSTRSCLSSSPATGVASNQNHGPKVGHDLVVGGSSSNSCRCNTNNSCSHTSPVDIADSTVSSEIMAAAVPKGLPRGGQSSSSLDSMAEDVNEDEEAEISDLLMVSV